MNVALGLFFLIVNLVLIFVGFLTRDKKADIKFTDFNTIIIGDLVGLSIINFVFGSTFNFFEMNLTFIISSIVISFLITTLLHQNYKFDTKESTNSGYKYSKITLHGGLHLVYCFYQLVIVILLVITLIDIKIFSYQLLIGLIIYISSVYLDYRKGILFVRNRR